MARQCNHPECTKPVFSHGYCQWHQRSRTDEKYLNSIQKRKEKVLQQSKSRAQKPREATGEKEWFDAMWKALPQKSFISDEDLKKYEGTKLFYNIFHHILNKKNYKKFRFYSKNIMFLTPQEHLDVHSMGKEELIRKNPMWVEYFFIWEQLKQEYHDKNPTS